MLTDAAKQFLNRMNSTAFKYKLGDEVDEKTQVSVVRYDFATQGGATGTINLLKDLANADLAENRLVLPDNAIIKHVYLDILTAMASAGGTGTIALNSEGAEDLLAAVDADTLSGIAAGIPVNTVATMIKLTAERTVDMTIGAEDLTAGKFDLYVEWLRGN